MESRHLISTCHTYENLDIVSFPISDEIRSCIEEATPTTETNKFNRCWRGIKYKKKLPSVLQWNIHFKNRTQEATPSQNGTAQTMSPQNRTEHTKTLQNVTEKPSVI
jgi:hypothetical protein